jgi:hypothetical protein
MEFVPTTVTVEQFGKISQLGKTTIYKMIKRGDLNSVRVYGRRLIVVQSYFDFVTRETAAEMRALTSATVRDRSRQAAK